MTLVLYLRLGTSLPPLTRLGLGGFQAEIFTITCMKRVSAIVLIGRSHLFMSKSLPQSKFLEKLYPSHGDLGHSATRVYPDVSSKVMREPLGRFLSILDTLVSLQISGPSSNSIPVKGRSVCRIETQLDIQLLLRVRMRK